MSNSKMIHEDLKYWIALKSVAGVGNVVFPALLEKFGSPQAVFGASAAGLAEVRGIAKETVKEITHFNQWDKVKAELELILKNKIDIITYQDKLYPEKLLNIYDRPPYIYVRGALHEDDINIAVVGSRQASSYGKYTTEKIGRELAQKGITVVSGMARGIDSAAHRGAISGRGRTIAVLGSGLDVIYPPENKKLYLEIIETGAVISEYPMGTPPRSSNFPARNRIISGMSYGVVIVEAGEKSGSLITARLALDQGREVFAVPGSIDSPGSRGTNKLIKQGAKLIENTEDILEEIVPQLETKRLRATESAPSPQETEIHPPELNAGERKIIALLSLKKLHIDDLISMTGLTSSEILSALTRLELKGIVQQHPGKLFSLKRQ
ncbi:MAG TPA: DNA-processing protein DprA [Smithella sp.]|nr:DNA-processing protein DprA [Smithella sp.]HRS97891.1 DNA-processing protein DprA [Smithella sp.]